MSDNAEEEAFTALHGIFPLGGPGAYLLEGKSGAGKNFLLEYFVAKSKLPFDNVWSLSTTEEETGSLDFIEKLFDTTRWAKTKSLNDLMHLVTVRKQSLARLKEELGIEERDAYVEKFPILCIVDDIGGTTNTRNSEKNPWYTLFTTVRHLGIYLVVLIQYHKQVGPAFITNSKALVTFDYSDDALTHFSKSAGMSATNEDKKTLQKFLKTRYNFLIWWKSWKSTNTLPDYPWLCDKITPSSATFTVNRNTYPTRPLIDRNELLKKVYQNTISKNDPVPVKKEKQHASCDESSYDDDDIVFTDCEDDE